MQIPSIIHGDDVSNNPRGDYSYQRYVAHDDDIPFNVLRIHVNGRHDTRLVVHGIRNYFIVSGEGMFVVEGREIAVAAEDLIVIQPGQQYSYEGAMELLEFNIATEGVIEHQDIE